VTEDQLLFSHEQDFVVLPHIGSPKRGMPPKPSGRPGTARVKLRCSLWCRVLPRQEVARQNGSSDDQQHRPREGTNPWDDIEAEENPKNGGCEGSYGNRIHRVLR
jgi:hypothetical protein